MLRFSSLKIKWIGVLTEMTDRQTIYLSIDWRKKEKKKEGFLSGGTDSQSVSQSVS